MPMRWPPVSPDAAKPSPKVAQGSSKVPRCNPVTPYEETKTPSKPTTQVIGSESSMLNSSATGTEKIKRHCRVSQESRMKQLESTEKHWDSNEKTQNSKLDNISLLYQPKQSRHFQWDKEPVNGLDSDRQHIESMSNIRCQQETKIQKIQPKLSGIGSLDYYPTISASGIAESGAVHDFGRKFEKKPDKADYISKEAADAIRQIELCISALQQVAEHVGPLENSASLHGSIEMAPDSIPGVDSVSPLMQIEQGIGTWSELSRARKVSSGIDNLLSEEVSQRVWKSNNLSQLPQVRNQNLKPGCVGKAVSKGHGKSSRRTSQVTVQNIKGTAEKIESLSTLLSQNYHRSGHGHKYVQGLRVPESQAKLSYVTPALLSKMPSQTEKENQDQNVMPQKEPVRKVGRYRSSNLTVSLGSKGLADRKIQVVDADHKLSGTKTKGTKREKGLPHPMIIRPTLPDPKCSQFSVSPTLDENWMGKEQVCVEKNNRKFAQWKKILPYKQGSEDTSLSSHASSSWTSQQAGISSSDSEEYLLPSHRPRDQRYACPTNSTDSEGYSLPGNESGGLDMGRTSSNESVTHPLPSGTSSSRSTRPSHHNIGPFSSSESEGYRPPNQVQVGYRMALSSRLAGSKSTRSVPSCKNFRSGNRQMKPKKQIGHLRRVKDKLALIFHHHHHHHHLHDGQDHSDQKTRVVGGGTSLMEKYAGKIIHGRNRNRNSEAYGEQAAEKLTKSVIRKVPDKNQHRHFHDLVEGLLRRVRNSRKSKPSKDSIKQAGRSHHSGKRAAKKLRWWKMFRHQRAVKLPSKPHAKLGFKGKKH